MKRILELTPENGEMLKPGELVDLHGAGPLTLQDRRVFNVLVENAWGPNMGRSGHWFEIATGELRDATDRNSRLSETVERLMRTICLVISQDKKVETRTPLLSSNELHTSNNDGNFRYKFTEELTTILKDSTFFAKLDKEVMRSFSSKYAFSLYEGLARRVRMKHVFYENLSINEMRQLLGVEDNKLDSYKNLNLRAIRPAVDEVNAISEISVNVEPKKKGRKVVGFVMGWNLKAPDQLTEAQRERERAKIGREARQKGKVESVLESDTN